jgi:predicted HTH transcriptional regulator
MVPEDAVMEGLVDAVVHRPYSAAGDRMRATIFAGPAPG